jgi:hypothetical protein
VLLLEHGCAQARQPERQGGAQAEVDAVAEAQVVARVAVRQSSWTGPS